MCDTCGCNVTHGNRHLLAPGGKLQRTGQGSEAVSVLKNLLSENDHTAAHNRQHFDRHGVFTVNLVHQALHQLSLDGIDILFIENVGNLVCPASFDLGQHRNVTLLSVPEGDDKPSKYPVMFRASDLVTLSKVDLLPVLDDFDTGRARDNVRALANPAPVLEISVKREDGVADWIAWLVEEVANHREVCGRGETLRPQIQPDGARLHGL
mgnify:CR=1 FL=1